MADNPVSLDKWRSYFSGANSDIFEIIEHAILVAASDCPYDFRLKRDRIAEVLFSCKVTKCFGCNRIELAVPSGDGREKNDGGEKCKSGAEAGGSKDTKESKVNSSRDEEDYDDDDHREVMEMNVNQVCNQSCYGDVEALTDKIEEESQILGEVLRIKEIVDGFENESDTMVLDSLRKLQLMPLSLDILKETEIGKSVNALRKHGSKDIRILARTLIEDWRLIVDAWYNATTDLADKLRSNEVRACGEDTTESGKTSVEEEEGLPSPPLDEGAFFATPTSMELSQFFDGMDDDGNPRNGGEFDKIQENGRRRTNKPVQKFESPNDSTTPPNAGNRSTLKKEAPLNKPNGPSRPKPPSTESITGRPKPSAQPNVNRTIKAQHNSMIQKKPVPAQKEMLNCDNEASVKAKLETAKRKLQERYQEAENAKKQRTIQVVELRDLPKQSLPKKPFRQWAQGRR